jgi:hypothetical protein
VLEETRRQAAEARMRVRELEDEKQRMTARLQAAEDRDKTETEKAVAHAARLEKKIATMEQQQARHEVAGDRKIPVELLEHVRGEDRALLEATADRWLTWHKTELEEAVKQAVDAALAAPRTRRTSDPVARGAPVAEPFDMNEYIRAGFRR